MKLRDLQEVLLNISKVVIFENFEEPLYVGRLFDMPSELSEREIKRITPFWDELGIKVV